MPRGAPIGPYIAQGLHKEPWVENILASKVHQGMFSKERLRKYREEKECPNCDKVCRDVVIIWASGPLIATPADMDDIAKAIVKVYENRDRLNSI